MRKTLLAVAIGLFTTTALAAGQHGNDYQNASSMKVDRTISFEAGDMWFTPGKLDITPGETVKFEISNTGNLQHEFVIGDAAAQEKHREMMRKMTSMDNHDEMAKKMSSSGHNDDGHSNELPAVTIAPGETTTLVWSAPKTFVM